MSTGPRPWIRRWLSAPVAVCGLAAGAIAIGTGFSTGGPPAPARAALYFPNRTVPAAIPAAPAGRSTHHPAPDSVADTVPGSPVTDPAGGGAAGRPGGGSRGGDVAPAPFMTPPATGAVTPAGGAGPASHPAGAPTGTATTGTGANGAGADEAGANGAGDSAGSGNDGSTSPDGSTSTVVPDYPVVTGPGPSTTTTTTNPPATTTTTEAGGSGTDS